MVMASFAVNVRVSLDHRDVTSWAENANVAPIAAFGGGRAARLIGHVQGQLAGSRSIPAGSRVQLAAWPFAGSRVRDTDVGDRGSSP